MSKKDGYSFFYLILVVLLATCSPAPTGSPVPTIVPTPTVSFEPTSPVSDPTTPLPLPTVQIGCKDSALYVKDVTIPDNTRLLAGEVFTKTWRLRNTGTCTWNIRYALVFVGGEQMGAKVITPLTETPPGETLDISVNLVAPAKEGAYTALFELRNPTGRALDIGTVTSIWVKIVTGKEVATPGLAATSEATPTGPACQPQQNLEYVAEILSKINDARAAAGLAPVKLSGQLSFAAQGHSDDMACNDFVGRTGSDGSTSLARVKASGYAASYVEEVIFATGTPQDAFSWWMNDTPDREVLLNPKAVNVGIGYSYLPGTAYGGYYTVDFAAP
jgi:uncharacterized protein YkwD